MWWNKKHKNKTAFAFTHREPNAFTSLRVRERRATWRLATGVDSDGRWRRRRPSDAGSFELHKRKFTLCHRGLMEAASAHVSPQIFKRLDCIFPITQFMGLFFFLQEWNDWVWLPPEEFVRRPPTFLRCIRGSFFFFCRRRRITVNPVWNVDWLTFIFPFLLLVCSSPHLGAGPACEGFWTEARPVNFFFFSFQKESGVDKYLEPPVVSRPPWRSGIGCRSSSLLIEKRAPLTWIHVRMYLHVFAWRVLIRLNISWTFILKAAHCVQSPSATTMFAFGRIASLFWLYILSCGIAALERPCALSKGDGQSEETPYFTT